MNTDLENRLKDATDLQLQQEKRIHKLESSQQSAQLEQLIQQIDELLKKDNGAALQESILQQAATADQLLAAIREQKRAISDLPKKITVYTKYLITDKARPYLLFGFIVVIITLSSIFGCVELFMKNNELHANSVKFRMLRQLYPSIAIETDSLYYQDPEGMEKLTGENESRQMAIDRAEEAAKQSVTEAKKAKGQLKDLRKQGSRKKR